MRRPTYLSPTSLALWRQNQDDFYLRYLADVRPPREPQNQAMSIGSAFDAFAKNYLYEKIYGKNHDPRFELKTLFEAQVEPHNRAWAWDEGAKCFKAYEATGSLADLIIELEGSIGNPKFETEVHGVVAGYREGVSKIVEGVPFLGKPDVYFINKKGARVILDWKVNGYCSNWGASPKPGYVKCREAGRMAVPHKEAMPGDYKGITINIAAYLEMTDEEWASQLAIYSWLCGEEVGSDFIGAIEQLAWRGGNLKVAQHRARLHADFQWKLYVAAQQTWEIVQSDHIFRDLSIDESKAKCDLLDLRANSMCNPKTEEDKTFDELTKSNWY